MIVCKRHLDQLENEENAEFPEFEQLEMERAEADNFLEFSPGTI